MNLYYISKYSSGKKLFLWKVLHAPIEKVFEAWTLPEQLEKWWGPRGFTNPNCLVDLQPGGRIHIDMTAPDGAVFPMNGIFHKIQRPVQLIFTSTAFEDDDSRLENLNTITFQELGGETRLTIESIVLRSHPELDEALEGMEEGWKQSLDKLAELIEQKS